MYISPIDFIYKPINGPFGRFSKFYSHIYAKRTKVAFNVFLRN